MTNSTESEMPETSVPQSTANAAKPHARTPQQAADEGAAAAIESFRRQLEKMKRGERVREV